MTGHTLSKTLDRRVLGKSGILVSEIGVGLWAAGGESWGATDDDEVLDAIDAALDVGANLFDTSDVYGAGHSEQLLGRAMTGRRDKFVVATKIGWQNFDQDRQQTQYTTVDKLIAGVESNLRRLNTDYIDLMQSHITYRESTMEIFVEGFQRLQEQGKIRAYGLSTSHFDYLKAFNQDGGCASLQVDYSVLNRKPEADIFPYCQEHDIGILVRGPLAMGILTGKFNRHTAFGADDWRSRWIENEDEYAIFLEDLAKVEQLEPLAEEHSLAQLALQFVLAHPAVTSAIPGAKNVRQVMENIEAGMLPPLTPEELARIEKITPEGGGRKIWPA